MDGNFLDALQVTLYDIFGYLFPGMVLGSGLVLFGWAVFVPAAPLVITTPSVAATIVGAITAYLLGHAIQALANIVNSLTNTSVAYSVLPIQSMNPSLPAGQLRPASRLRRAARQLRRVIVGGEVKPLPEQVVRLVKERVDRLLNIGAHIDLPPELLALICEEALTQAGVEGNRDLYQYREGFYRGLAIASLALASALIVRAGAGTAVLQFGARPVTVTASELLFIAAIILAVCPLAWRRYRRFARYRVVHAVMGFLIHTGQTATPPSTQREN